MSSEISFVIKSPYSNSGDVFFARLKSMIESSSTRPILDSSASTSVVGGGGPAPIDSDKDSDKD